MEGLEALLGEPVSRETLERLERYRTLLEKWNPKINLISRSTVADAASRHFLDSAQLARKRGNARSWVDLGAGGGFPGLVLAILYREIAPDMRMTLVESDQRKASFLREAARLTDTNAEILATRIENLRERRFDVVSARALAPLTRLLFYSHDLLSPEGRCVFLKGARCQSELDEARKEWQFDVMSSPSATQNDSTVLVIEGLRRV